MIRCLTYPSIAATSINPYLLDSNGTPSEPKSGISAYLLRIGALSSKESREENQSAFEAGLPLPLPYPPDDEYNYWAEAIRIGDCYFYQVGGTTVPISEYEYTQVITNPNTYYFSTALRLDRRVYWARQESNTP